MKTTPEEKAAKKIIDIISDLRLDLNMIGFYFAYIGSSVMYNRLLEILETAEEEKREMNVRR